MFFGNIDTEKKMPDAKNKMRSIMGDEALNFRVRNGIGCTLSSMNTKTNLYVILIDRGLGRGKFLKNKPLGLLVLVS